MKRWGALLLGSLLLILVSHYWLFGRAGLALEPALPQDPDIQVYFNQTRAAAYTDPYRHMRRHGDDLEQVILTAIAEAQSSIDIAVQEINLPRVARALRDRAQAGIPIRIIVEHQYNRVWKPLTALQTTQLEISQQSRHAERQRLIDTNQDGTLTAQEADQGDAIRIFQKAGIPLIDDTADGSEGSGLMHHKFMVVDHKTVILGSANWTLSGMHGDFAQPTSRGNANALLRIQSPDLAALLLEEFNLMWGDGPQGKPDSRFGLQKPARSPRTLTLPGAQVTVQFAPTSDRKPWSQSVNGLIAQTLSQATQRIDLALFVFSEQAIADTLAPKSQAGVTIQALVDRNFIYRSYSEALDMLGTAIPDERCQYEAHNRPWALPIAQVGTPNLAEGDKLHHKFAAIDGHTVIIGSHNWSAAANHTNDEDLLVIHNPTVAAHFHREFERLATDADMGLTPDLQIHIQRQRKHCNGASGSHPG